MPPPTRALPSLRRDDLSADDVDSTLRALSQWLDDADDDAYERSYAQQWLTRLVGVACRRPGWDSLLEPASSLLARLSGPSGAPAHVTTCSFPLHLPHERERQLDLRIRTDTLLGDSTGAHVWPAGRHLARRIARSPTIFFPSSPLRVLELGSGTGLVGLAAAAVLSVMGATAEVVLSDNDPHTLANLSRNFAANADLFASPAITVSTRALDWRAEPVDGDARFDVLLGGDVVYDTHHAGLLRRAIETHLAPGGTAHIVMALRPTHTVELRQVEVVFVEDAACRLVIAKRETEVVDGEPLAYESLWIRWR